MLRVFFASLQSEFKLEGEEFTAINELLTVEVGTKTNKKKKNKKKKKKAGEEDGGDAAAAE